MKIVRLDRRFRVHKQGFTVALRFDSYREGRDYDKACYRIFGSPYYPTIEPIWKDYFSRQRRGSSRVYYIAFRDEKYITWVQLAMQQVDPE
jgi:hypothetical protein